MLLLSVSVTTLCHNWPGAQRCLHRAGEPGGALGMDNKDTRQHTGPQCLAVDGTAKRPAVVKGDCGHGGSGWRSQGKLARGGVMELSLREKR